MQRQEDKCEKITDASNALAVRASRSAEPTPPTHMKLTGQRARCEHE